MGRKTQMENMEINKIFAGKYAGKRVLLTGHTGFKGAWLAYWLELLGAETIGYSLDPSSDRNLFDYLQPKLAADYRADIRDFAKLKEVIANENPDIIFHLAAQAFVKSSYIDPVTTFETNVNGSINILEAVRELGIEIPVLMITTDKVYKNNEWVYGYRESDSLGGYDPYSASKAAAEIAINSYRQSFFNPENGSKTLVASLRAGNVIGGGDWSPFRIVPDIVKATENGESLFVRSPESTRPWQHVLEPLSGYLLIGQKLLNGEKKYADAWNFGPKDDAIVTVKELVNSAKKYWETLAVELNTEELKEHEAKLLKLDISKAIYELKWKPVWSFEDTVARTFSWYRDLSPVSENDSEAFRKRSLQDIEAFVKKAEIEKLDWL